VHSFQAGSPAGRRQAPPRPDLSIDRARSPGRPRMHVPFFSTAHASPARMLLRGARPRFSS
jgi:hypothetical protein